MALIYKICPAALWRDAQERGHLPRRSGGRAGRLYPLLHRRAGAETAAKHFARRDDLLLVAVEARDLGESLRYEPSRGGDLFPHLYAPLPLSAVRWVKPLPLGPDGRHAFPAEVPGGAP